MPCRLGFGAQKAKNASKAGEQWPRQEGRPRRSTPRVLNEVRLTEAFSG
jgi:hypothetical protein